MSLGLYSNIEMMNDDERGEIRALGEIWFFSPNTNLSSRKCK